ncbi:hypothetical protein GWI33_011745, partial [Rhynchophorus ferrugineus]
MLVESVTKRVENVAQKNKPATATCPPLFSSNHET